MLRTSGLRGSSGEGAEKTRNASHNPHLCKKACTMQHAKFHLAAVSHWPRESINGLSYFGKRVRRRSKRTRLAWGAQISQRHMDDLVAHWSTVSIWVSTISSKTCVKRRLSIRLTLPKNFFIPQQDRFDSREIVNQLKQFVCCRWNSDDLHCGWEPKIFFHMRLTMLRVVVLRSQSFQLSEEIKIPQKGLFTEEFEG